MDEKLIKPMKRDVRYAAINGCPPPSDKYRAVIQRLRDDAVRRYRVHFDGSHSIPQKGEGTGERVCQAGGRCPVFFGLMPEGREIGGWSI